MKQSRCSSRWQLWVFEPRAYDKSISPAVGNAPQRVSRRSVPLFCKARTFVQAALPASG